MGRSSGSGGTRRGGGQNRVLNTQAGERVRVKHHMSNIPRGMGGRVICRNRRSKAASGDSSQGWIRGWACIPIKSNISEFILGQAITTKGRLPIIHHGMLPRLRHGQARTQNTKLKGRPGRKGNAQQSEVGPSQHDLGPKRAVVQDLQGREPRGGHSDFHLRGGNETIRPHKEVVRVVSTDRDRGSGAPSVSRAVDAIQAG